MCVCLCVRTNEIPFARTLSLKRSESFFPNSRNHTTFVLFLPEITLPRDRLCESKREKKRKRSVSDNRNIIGTIIVMKNLTLASGCGVLLAAAENCGDNRNRKTRHSRASVSYSSLRSKSELQSITCNYLFYRYYERNLIASRMDLNFDATASNLARSSRVLNSVSN